jgi:CrcB protein
MVLGFAAMKWLLVFVLGGAGALARVGVAAWFPVRELPWATLAVNVLGCLAIGVLFAFFEERSTLSLEWRIATVGGFLGGFTTFSAFGLETFTLIQGGQWPIALLYALGSVVLGLSAVAVGIVAAQELL